MKKIFYLLSYVFLINTFIFPTVSFSQRIEGPIVYYTFESVENGNIIRDVSGSNPTIDLEMTTGVTKIADRNGVVITNVDNSYTHGLFSTEVPENLTAAIQSSNALTVEFWGLPVDTMHDDARLVTYSFDGGNRNFSLMFEYGSIETRLRTTTSGNNGYYPNWIAGSPVSGATPASPFHVVWTYDAGAEYVYFNGEKMGEFNDRGNDISNWDNTYKFVIGTEDNNDATRRQYEGEVYMVAIYDKALSLEEVKSNFDAGDEPPVENSLESKYSNQYHINVFPNPVSDELTLKPNDYFLGKTYLTLYNILGEKIIKETLSGSEHRMDMKAVPNGVYFITVTGKQGNFIKKIVKK